MTSLSATTAASTASTMTKDTTARPLLVGAALATVYLTWGSTYLANCAAVGLLLPAAGQGLVTVAEHRAAPSGLTALVVAGVPLWVICLRVTGGPPTGALLVVVVASAAWALGTWLQPRLMLPEDTFMVVAYELLVGGTVLTLLGLLGGQRAAPAAYSRDTWLAWGFLIVVGSVLVLTAYNWLFRTTGVSLVATYAYVNPAVALLLGWLLLGEPVTAVTLAWAAVVVVGVALVVGAERRTGR